jgi:hypothetical protein
LHNDDFKDTNEAFENQVEVCNDEKVKTEPDDFENEDMKALEDHVEGQRIKTMLIKSLLVKKLDS